MPPVHPDEVRLRERASGIRGADVEGAPAVGGGVAPHAPGAADVVLEPGAADGGMRRVAIEEHLHLTFSVPDALVEDPNSKAASEKAPGPSSPSVMTRSDRSRVGFSRRNETWRYPLPAGKAGSSV